MRSDLFDNINPKVALAPVATAITDNTVQVCGIIDSQGAESVTYVITTGNLADADVTFAVTMEHGDDPALADTSVPATTDLLGTTALASFKFSDDSKCFKLGYVGSKRFTRMTITPANNTGAAPLTVIAIQGHLRNKPSANPPT